MAWVTVSGITAANAGASGLKEFATGNTLAAADLNKNWQDAQGHGVYADLPGVLEGGVCTAALLVVTVPADTVYFARSVWATDGSAQTVSVTDSATSYIWACSDGELRTTSTTTPPNGYTVRTACLLCKAVASGGVAVVDNSVQQRAVYGDTTARTLWLPGGWAPVPDTIPDARVGLVPDAHQLAIMDTLTVTGTLRATGKVRIT